MEIDINFDYVIKRKSDGMFLWGFDEILIDEDDKDAIRRIHYDIDNGVWTERANPECTGPKQFMEELISTSPLYEVVLFDYDGYVAGI